MSLHLSFATVLTLSATYCITVWVYGVGRDVSMGLKLASVAVIVAMVWVSSGMMQCYDGKRRGLKQVWRRSFVMGLPSASIMLMVFGVVLAFVPPFQAFGVILFISGIAGFGCCWLVAPKVDSL